MSDRADRGAEPADRGPRASAALLRGPRLARAGPRRQRLSRVHRRRRPDRGPDQETARGRTLDPGHRAPAAGAAGAAPTSSPAPSCWPRYERACTGSTIASTRSPTPARPSTATSTPPTPRTALIKTDDIKRVPPHPADRSLTGIPRPTPGPSPGRAGGRGPLGGAGGRRRSGRRRRYRRRGGR